MRGKRTLQSGHLAQCPVVAFSLGWLEHISVFPSTWQHPSVIALKQFCLTILLSSFLSSFLPSTQLFFLGSLMNSKRQCLTASLPLSLLLSLCLCGLPGDLVFSGGTVSFWSQDKSLAASLSALSLFTSLCSLPLLASYFQLPPAFKVALDGCTCGGGGCPGCWRTAP